MTIFFGTVVRWAPISSGGELIRLNWKTKQVEARVTISPHNPDIVHDPNPRGSSRGCRGIQHHDGMIISANYHTLEFFDQHLNHVRDMSHGLMVGLHETFLSGRQDIWVSSTSIDGALKFDIKTGQLKEAIWPRELPALARYLNLEPLAIDKSQDNRLQFLPGETGFPPPHLHLNAIAEWKGQVFALFNSYGVIANLTKDRIAIEDPELKGGHNLIILEDGTVLVNNSRQTTVRIYNLKTNKLVDTIPLRKFGWVRKLKILGKLNTFFHFTRMSLKHSLEVTARPLFLRGMDVAGDKLFLGLSPASIVCVDITSKRLVDAYRYSSDVRACVHGLKVLE